MNIILIISIFLITPAIVIGCLTLIEGEKRRRLRIWLDKSFNAVVTAHQLSIDDVEFIRKKAIGLDIEKKKLVFVDKSKPFQTCINLEDFKFCLLSERKDPGSNNRKIFLELVTAGKNENVLLNFFSYASDTKYATSQLRKKAAYWKNKINLVMNARKTNRGLEYVL